MALAVSGAWSSAAASEAAPTERYQLETRGWRPGCPSPDRLQKEIVSSLGWNPFSPQAEKAVLVSIEWGDEGPGGTVELRGPDQLLLGKRAIAASHRRCTQLVKALSLVVTLALDERAQRVPAKTPELPAAAPGVAPTTAIQTTIPPTQPARLRLQWSVALGADGSVASGPGAGIGGLFAVEGRGPRWSIGLEGAGNSFLGTTVSGGRVAGSVEAATVVGCWRPRFGGQYLGACGLATGGLEQARASGFASAHAAAGPSLAAGARLLAEVPIVRALSLILNADPAVAVVRARFTLGNLDLWQAPPVSLAAGVRLAYAL